MSECRESGSSHILKGSGESHVWVCNSKFYLILMFLMENERGELVSHGMHGEAQGDLVSLFLPRAPHSTAQLSTGLIE